MNKSKLEIGDEVVNISTPNRFFEGKKNYTFSKVIKLTKTRAYLENGDVVLNENKSNNFYTYPRGSYYKLVTPIIKELAQKEQLLKEASKWFWSKYKGKNPPREDLLLFKTYYEKYG